jgi:hypothetical protein
MSSYSVERDGVQENVRKLDAAAEDIGTARSQIPSFCPIPDVFGGEDSGPAFASFMSAWQDETKTLQAAIEEIVGRLRVTSTGYGLAEHSASARLSEAVGAGRTAPAAAPAGGSQPAPSPFG